MKTPALDQLRQAANTSKTVPLAARLDAGLIKRLDGIISKFNETHDANINRSVVVREALENFISDLERTLK